MRNHQHLINPAKFTFDIFRKAAHIVMTRAFGWSLPYIMLVPFADNCNHFCIENDFEMFNSRLSRQLLKKDFKFNNYEKEYFTRSKGQINFFKHFEEDMDQEDLPKVDQLA